MIQLQNEMDVRKHFKAIKDLQKYSCKYCELLFELNDYNFMSEHLAKHPRETRINSAAIDDIENELRILKNERIQQMADVEMRQENQINAASVQASSENERESVDANVADEARDSGSSSTAPVAPEQPDQEIQQSATTDDIVAVKVEPFTPMISQSKILRRPQKKIEVITLDSRESTPEDEPIEEALLEHFKNIKNGNYVCNYCQKLRTYQQRAAMVAHLCRQHPLKAKSVVNPNADPLEHEAVVVKTEESQDTLDDDESYAPSDASLSGENDSDESMFPEFKFVKRFANRQDLDKYRNMHGFNKRRTTKTEITYGCKTYIRTDCKCTAKSTPDFRFFQKGKHINSCLNEKIMKPLVRLMARGRRPRTPDLPTSSMNNAARGSDKSELVTNQKFTESQLQWLQEISNQYGLDFNSIGNSDFVFHKGNTRLDGSIRNENITLVMKKDSGLLISEEYKDLEWQHLLTTVDGKCKILFG